MENLEKNIKDKLQHSKIEIDTNELWNGVYPHIKPKKRKRLFLYLFFGFAWLLSLIAVGWHFSNLSKDASQSKPKTNIIETQNYPETNTKLASKAKGLDKNSPTVSEVGNRITTESKSQKTSSQNISNGNSVIADQGKGSIVNRTSRPEASKFIKQASGSSVNKPNANNKLITTAERSGNFTSRTGSTSKEGQSSMGISNSTELTQKIIDDPSTAENKRISFSNTKLYKTDLNLAYNIPQPVIPSSMYSEYVYDSEYTAFSFYALGGISSIDKVLAIVNNVASNNLMNRATSESPLESLFGEFGVRYNITPNFQLSAGLNYIRINERVEDSYSVTDTVLLENVIIENIISARGSEPVYGDLKAERTINTDLRAYNRYSDLALSLELTCMISGELLSPYLSAGLQQSVSSSHTGYWLLDTNNLYDISEDASSYLRKKYGLGLRFGAGVDFEISDRTSLRIGGRYTKYLNAVTNKNYELSQKYNLLGLSAGLNIKI